MKELKDIFHWVEETTVKLELQILTEERLKQMGDVQYKNKWKRYVSHKELTDGIIHELLDVSEDMHILDKLTNLALYGWILKNFYLHTADSQNLHAD